MRHLVLLALAACSPADREMPAGSHIEVSPATLDVTIVNGGGIVQAYTATRIDPDGTATDITGRVTFELENASFGVWTGPSLAITGMLAGPTHVIARDGGDMGQADLVVRVKQTRGDGPVPANAADLFAHAMPFSPNRPTIVYPDNQILLPPNLGEFDVHWRDSANNLFEIALRSTYTDITVYKQSGGDAFITLTAAEWLAAASTREQLTLTVAGLSTANPTSKGEMARMVDVTNEVVQGGMYYWTTQPTQGVYRYDVAKPEIAPAAVFTPAQQPTPCIGCHALSRDGTKLAITIDHGDGRGTIVDLTNNAILVDYTGNPQYWNFATFTPDASKVVTLYHGQMVLRQTQGGAILASIPNNSPAIFATHPELSPDGTRLANVETTNVAWDFQVYDGSIVTRTFDASTNTFGAIQTLVPNAPGASNFYPSWSPDGQWLLFTRTTGNSYSDDSAQVWVVKADGSQPPIKLAAAGPAAQQMNSWARWAPFQQTFGPNQTPLYFITFSSVRPFGVRAKVGTQIWMAPFFPSKAAAGQDPSGPAFRMPFQRIDTSNHIAQWTQAVVIDTP